MYSAPVNRQKSYVDPPLFFQSQSRSALVCIGNLSVVTLQRNFFVACKAIVRCHSKYLSKALYTNPRKPLHYKAWFFAGFLRVLCVCNMQRKNKLCSLLLPTLPPCERERRCVSLTHGNVRCSWAHPGFRACNMLQHVVLSSKTTFLRVAIRH